MQKQWEQRRKSRRNQLLGKTQTLKIIRLPLKTELVPIYNRHYDSDEDELNKKGQRIITYKEVLVG